MARRRLRNIVIAAAVVAVVAAVIAIRRLRPVEVVVAPVTRGPATEVVYATGTVAPRERVIVKARIAEHLGRVLVDEGDRVERGQLLATIEDPARRSALAKGRSRLATARTQASARSPQLAALAAQVRAVRSQLELARTELARTERLAAGGAVAVAEVDAARARVEQLAAQTAALEEQERSTRLELGAARDQIGSEVATLAEEVAETSVRSPIDGIVLRREVEPGELVSVNQTLFEVADAGEPLLELQVDEADIARVRDGPAPSEVALSFYAFADHAFAGHVTEILPDPDPVRRSYTVRVALDQPIPGLRVGMTAEANVIVQRKASALVLPIEAVDGNSAWFVESGRAVARDVVLGIRDLTHVEVVSGAREGELAIVSPSVATLARGERVSIAERRAR
jgi:multidrug efflux pump subunit AcrA (membrane-fusion protein)